MKVLLIRYVCMTSFHIYFVLHLVFVKVAHYSYPDFCIRPTYPACSVCS